MKNLLFFLMGLALLAALFVLFKPAAPPAPQAPVVSQAPLAPQAPQAPSAAGSPVTGVMSAAPRRFELVLTGGKLSSGPEILSVTQGEIVVLHVASDQDGELHLHGYDLTLGLSAGGASEMTFPADRSGRFEYELHGGHSHASLGALEVQPR